MHDMSNNATHDAGALLEDAVAAVILDEMDKQRYTQVELQRMSGVKSRTFANYFTARSRSIPTPILAAVAEALGLTGSEILRRAEQRIALIDDTEAELLAGMSGRPRMLAMRRYVRGQQAKTDGVEMRAV
jgi:hypothetical protein